MLRLYNTLTRQVENFIPINQPSVGMYSCGPTVYDYQHIGNMRRYVGDDILVRVLESNGYDVKQVMNITDVGHLVSDSDTGEDKMERGAKRLGTTVWEIAKKFEQHFFDSEEKLNIKKPSIVLRATDYIKDQIELITILEEKGYTYIIEDGVYFDTSKFSPKDRLTHQLSEDLKAGARVEMVKGKKNPTDFALWKFSPNLLEGGKKREMEWESPWGVGFPGWHIECSAMSMKILGPTFDIHTGGIDHIPVHHTNEIIQSEAASGRKFVNYWVHHGHMLVSGEKMSKSLGNTYTVQDVIERGFDPLSLRYLYLQTHYRQEMNFTWEALEAAQTAFNRLRGIVSEWSQEPKTGCAEIEQRFFASVNDDLNMSKALAVVWDLARSDFPDSAKAQSLFKLDKILGLDLEKSRLASQKPRDETIPGEIVRMVREREELRKQGRYHLADQLRNKVKKLGYDIQDKDGQAVVKKA